MNSTRKSSGDPLTFLSELQKKSKFCREYKVIDGVECEKCHEKVNVIPKDANATEKYVLQVFFKGVNHNEFYGYITNELGRTGAKSSFEEINKLWLQFTASTRLEYKNSNNSKIRRAETKKNQNSQTIVIHATSGATSQMFAKMHQGKNGTLTARKPSKKKIDGIRVPQS